MLSYEFVLRRQLTFEFDDHLKLEDSWNNSIWSRGTTQKFVASVDLKARGNKVLKKYLESEKMA